jgi:hypothetical protein
MSDPILLIFNLGPEEFLILLGCCGFPVVAGAIGAVLTVFLLRPSKSREEE